MPKLSGYQLDRDTSPEVLDRPMVAAVMESKCWKTERTKPFAVIVGDLPAVDAAEETLARREGGKVALDVRPGPIGDVSEPVAAPGFRATRAKRACGVGHVALGASENGADLEARAVCKREDRLIRLG